MNTLAHTWHRHTAAPAQAAPQDGVQYTLTLPIGAQRTLARGWLWLAMAALIGSGLFSLLLVLSRTPGVNRWLPGVDFFRVALVVHVDLSVLVWFVALAGCCGASTAPRALLARAGPPCGPRLPVPLPWRWRLS
jgi:hypothetical protein